LPRVAARTPRVGAIRNPQSAIRNGKMRHRLEYAAVRALIVAVRVMPIRLVRACGTALGLAFYTLDGAHRRIAHRNLAAAFPARPARERRAIRRVMRTLHEGRGVAVLIDQHIMSRDAIYVDFFERPAATTSAVAALALRTGAPVVPVFALPLGSGRYRLIYEHAIEAPGPDSPDAVRELTQRCTDVLEMYVRRHPELWLWMHRRWREDDQAAEHVAGMFPSGAGGEAGRADEGK